MSTPEARPGFRYLLANRTFGLLWLGQAISSLGDIFYDVAVVWYLLALTGSALAAGGIYVGTIVGRQVGSLLAGGVLDRVHPRWVMLGADAARFLLTLGAGIPWLLGYRPAPLLLYGLAFALAVGSGFFGPARNSALPQIVPREHLLRVNSLDARSFAVVNALAWIGGGLAVTRIGPAATLVFDASTFLISCVFVGAARWQSPSEREPQSGNPLAALRVTATWAYRDRLVRIVLGAETLRAIGAGFFLASLPLLVKEVGGSGALYGGQGAVFWSASIAASVVLSFWSTQRVGRLYAGGATLSALGNSLAGFAPAPAWLLGGVGVAGLGAPAWDTGHRSLLQAHAPPDARGRIFALLSLLSGTALLPCWLLGGWLADRFGSHPVMIAAALSNVAIGLYLLLSPSVRAFRLDAATGTP